MFMEKLIKTENKIIKCDVKSKSVIYVGISCMQYKKSGIIGNSGIKKQE